MSFFVGQNPLSGSSAIDPDAQKPWRLPISKTYFYDPNGPHKQYYFQSGLPSIESTDQSRFVFRTGVSEFNHALFGLNNGYEISATARDNIPTTGNGFSLDINWFGEMITFNYLPFDAKIAIYCNAIDEQYGSARFSAWTIDETTGAKLTLLDSQNHYPYSYAMDGGPYLMTANLDGIDAFISSSCKLYEMCIWNQNSELKERLVPFRTGDGSAKAAMKNTVNSQLQELQGNAEYAILSIGTD